MSVRTTLAGALVGLAIAVAASLPLPGALDAFNSAQSASRALAGVLAAPPPEPALADARRTAASSAGVAVRVATLRVRRAANAGGVLIETVAAAKPAAPRIAVVSVTASGSERAVLAFVDGVERGDPVLRWQQWRMTPAPGGTVRMEGEVIVPWR